MLRSLSSAFPMTFYRLGMDIFWDSAFMFLAYILMNYWFIG